VAGETGDVSTFIGRRVPPVCPQGCKRVRYEGVQATKTFAKLKALSQTAVARVTGVVQGALQLIAPMPYRPRYQQSTGRDPWRCPPCHSAMGVWRIWPPTSGMIHDELEAIRQGKYAAPAPRAAPTGGPGRTLWPASGGISLTLPGLRGREAGQGSDDGGRRRRGEIPRGIDRQAAHNWVSRLQRRDHGVRRARALVRPQGVTLIV